MNYVEGNYSLLPTFVKNIPNEARKRSRRGGGKGLAENLTKLLYWENLVDREEVCELQKWDKRKQASRGNSTGELCSHSWVSKYIVICYKPKHTVILKHWPLGRVINETHEILW